MVLRVEDATKLMERVRARDASAFEALYEGYYRLVYGLALRVLSDPNLAEDATQAVFLKIWKSPKTFREGNWTAWLARVTRNCAVDMLRAKKLRPESELPESMPAEDALEDAALANLDGEAISAAIAKLPDEQRALIEMGFFGAITHEEIARRTKLPLGTVKTRIRTGLRKLRSALEGATQ